MCQPIALWIPHLFAAGRMCRRKRFSGQYGCWPFIAGLAKVNILPLQTEEFACSQLIMFRSFAFVPAAKKSLPSHSKPQTLAHPNDSDYPCRLGVLGVLSQPERTAIQARILFRTRFLSLT